MSFSSDPGTIRLPKIRALLDDTVCVFPYNAAIVHPASFGAATFAIAISLKEITQYDASYWASVSRVRVRIQASLSPVDPFIDLIEGYCDTVHIHPIAGFVVLQGRDLSASLLDTRTFSNFQNRTPGEITANIAEAHGLTTTFAADGPYAGRTYESDTTALALTQFAQVSTDWDMLVTLAQTADCDLYMSGDTICFQPNADTSKSILSIAYDDLIDLRMNRILPLSDGVDLTVMSWHSAQQEAVTETFASNGDGYTGPPGARSPRRYAVIQPNLQSKTARTLATKIAKTIARDALSVHFKMPADLTLTARQHFTLVGSNTVFDRPFKIARIARIFRSNSGFTQTIQATLAT